MFICVQKKNLSLKNFLYMKITTLLVFAFILFTYTGCSPEKIELDWVEEDGYRWAELKKYEKASPGFEKISSSITGITIENTLTEDQINENRVLLNGSGVAAGDIDGDGLTDLYFTNLNGKNRLYKNLGGFQFEDITDQAGVAHDGYLSTGTLFADVNGNGYLDLFISSIDNDNSLYLNDGNGNFQLQEESGLGPSKGSMSMALADINGNGYPDLYVVNYKKKSVRDLYSFRELSRENIVLRDRIVPPFDEDFVLIRNDNQLSEPKEIAEADELYLNNGDGSFTKATDLRNIFLDQNGNPFGLQPDWGLTARFQDLTGNGLPDLYVSNDFWTPDRIWINQGNSTFRAMDTLAIRNSSYSSMAVDFSDINRNGYSDIFVVEMLSNEHSKKLVQMEQNSPYSLKMGEYRNRPLYNRNSLFLNRGDHTYSEISYFSGLEASGWSWATRFMDVTLDGYEDILVNTGFKLDLQDLDGQMTYVGQSLSDRTSGNASLLLYPELREKNKAFRNNGDLSFTDIGEEWGFDSEDISHGMAVADLNNDGLLDLAVSRMEDEAMIFRNKSAGSRIAVRLKGETPNTQSIGAKVTLRGGPVESQSKQVYTSGEYLSGSDALTVFAADPSHSNHQLLITWPDGTESQINGLHSDRIYEFYEADLSRVPAANRQNTNVKNAEPLFEDVSNPLAHRHHEDPYDDYTVQPLLPNKLSQLGPGIAWFDVTSDGRDELIVGSGRGGEASVFRVEDNRSFSKMDFVELTDRVSGDQAGLAGWTANGRNHLVVGMANYEQGTPRVPSAVHYQIENGNMIAVDYLPGTLSTTGPVAAADYSGDGQMDLFIGGRFLPGQYPRDASSRLFQYRNGEWVPDQQNNQIFDAAGLVTDAVFVDIDNDGTQDLILSTEWGAVKIFINDDGLFTERTVEWGLDRLTGMWQGIATGDFTGNGYPDIVVSNRGENSPYQIEDPDKPLKLFFEDFNQNQQLDIIDSYYDEATGGYVPRRKYLDFTPLHENVLLNIGSHREFASSTVAELTHREEESIPFKSVNTLQHMIFINNEGNGFTPVPLPDEAQFSAGFYAGIADMDNDGNEDIFMSQNFFPVYNPQSNPRLDSGRGLWLKGDGTGNFEALPGHVTGIEVYGDQRGAALGDFDLDGRVDLVVSQNAAETRLFRNTTEKRGIRITLTNGPSGNSSGVGSSLRLMYENGDKGPARYIQAGSGYFSQNSFTQVMGTRGNPTSVEVTWFDGTTQTVLIEQDQTEVIISYPN